MRRVSRVAVTVHALAALLGACSSDALTPESEAGAPLGVEVSALSLAGVGDVLWDVEVVNGATPARVVWHKRLSSSRYGDGGGSASVVGTCDADPATRENTVRVWVVGVYGAPVTNAGEFAAGGTAGAGAVVGDALAFENPTTVGPLTQTVACVENGDQAVSFDVALMRPAQQGFFDIAVSFNDIFCSAKFDCCRNPAGATCAPDGSEDILLLFDADGARASTMVLGFACTAGLGDESATQLYLDALQLDCTGPGVFGADITLSPAGPAGNQCVPGSNGMGSCAGVVTEADPQVVDADSVLYQLAVYRGVEPLTSGAAASNKLYWNVALGVKRPAIASCRLRARGTADDVLGTGAIDGGAIGAGVVYPFIQWDVDLAACTQEPLTFGAAGAMVRPEYTQTTGSGTAFAYGYAANFPAGPFCTPPCQNGGQCSGGACACPSGYGGDGCEIAPNACLPVDPCQNGGVCSPVGAGYTCACVGGYSGIDCEVAPNACAPVSPCQNGGACTPVGVGYSCACVGGYSGTDCEIPPDPCAPNPCQNGGGCTPAGVDYTCTCVGSYTGDDCEIEITACAPTNPCQNGGTCSLGPSGYVCDCAEGYGGDDCELELPCGLSEAPCPEGQFCTPGGVCVPDGTTQNDTPVSISPPSISLLVNTGATFTAADGNAPYVFSLLSGGGDLDGGDYTAPPTAGSAVVRVTDAFGVTADASITIAAALGLSPSAVEVDQAVTFAGSGGIPGYTYALVSGGGTLVGADYTAPSAPGPVTIRVTDSAGHSYDALVTIYDALAISPAATHVQVNSTRVFGATGGVGGYTYSVVSGGGSFAGATYTAPATPSSATVRVTDGLGHTSEATVTVYPALVISPSAPTVEVNETVTFSASGGSGALTLSKPSGAGTLVGNVYTAPSTVGTGAAVVRVTDALGNTKDANITIIAALNGACSPNPCLNGGLCTIDTDPDSETGYICDCVDGYSGERCEEDPPPCGASGLPCDPGYFCTEGGEVCVPNGTTPNPVPVSISPSTATIMVNAATSFTASDGNAPYAFSVASGDGALVGSTYTAPPWAETAVIRVTDAFGVTSEATVTVRPPLVISPATPAVAVNGQVAFTASGGIGSYAYAKISGGGTLVGATYTAPATPGTAVVRVTDGVGNISDATVTVSAFAIVPNTASVVTGGQIVFSASGGTAPYTYAITSGGGSMAGATYTAPGSAGSATVRVTSANGWTATASVTIYAPLVISPSAPSIMATKPVTFSTTGGLGAVSYSKVSGGGTLAGATYTAGASAGSAVIRATDGVGNTSDATVTVYALLTLMPATSYVLPGEAVVFAASGGTGGYNYSVVIGGGSFAGSTYTASGSAGTSVVRVTDGAGNTAEATVTVYGYNGVSAGGTTVASASTCGVRSDGTLWCWGYNNYGQLGIGSTTQQTWPARVGADMDWSKVAVGTSHACATKTDGTLWCWGYNANGRLGDGTTTQRTAPVQIGTDTDWVVVTAGYAHTCAIKTGGTLWCWGLNTNGQLGTGNTTQRTSPFQVGTLATWSSVSAGSNASSSTCATQSNGTLWCWGYNSSYQLGQGNTTQRTSPVQVQSAVTTWGSVSMGYTSACATRTDGTLWCWGANGNSRLGDGTTTTRTTPVQIGAALGSWSTVNVGTAFGCATQTSGTMWCWGFNDYGQVGDGTQTTRSTPVQVGTSTSWVGVGAGPEHACGARADGTLHCWGWDVNGQLGVGGSIRVVSPVLVTTNVSSVAAADRGHTCATKTDGTTWCWGANTTYGMLGDGTVVTKSRPVQEAGMVTTWTGVAAGFGVFHTCAHRADHRMFCWGRSYRGALGNGSTTTRTSPYEVLGGAVWEASALGYYHTCATRTNGTLWCWGRNDYGGLGNGVASTANNASPIQVGTATTWDDLSLGQYYSCATQTNGKLWCWGRNNGYQLGDGTTTTRTSPIQVTTATTWSRVGTGQTHTCAVRTDGTLWCWGNNGSGRLGDGTTTNRTTPVRIGTDTNWSDVSLGYTYSCGLRTNGTLWCWGANTNGQLGDGTLTQRTTPVQVGSASDWVAVSAGQYHTCGIRAGGAVYCWGYNNYAQIGASDPCTTGTTWVCQRRPVQVP